jgi:hypothetical protein
MSFDQPFITTLIGSFPYLDSAALCPRLASEIQIPAWPQLPRRTFRENMYAVQCRSARHRRRRCAPESLLRHQRRCITRARGILRALPG